MGWAGLMAVSSTKYPSFLQPTGSTGSTVTTPPPLVRGTQNIPSGKPSLQVSSFLIRLLRSPVKGCLLLLIRLGEVFLLAAPK